MRLILLPFAAVALGAPSKTPPQPLADMPVVNPLAQPDRCPETPMSLARKQAERPDLMPLDRLPAATMFAAVDRRVGGCAAPLVLSAEPIGR